MGLRFDNFVKRKTAEYADSVHPFTTETLNPAFIKAWETGEKVTVHHHYRGKFVNTMTGYVGITTGWKPVFLLKAFPDSIGSSRIIGMEDKKG